MKTLRILNVYLGGCTIGLCAILLLTIPFPDLPGWVGLVVGAIVVVPASIITNKIIHE